MKNFAFKFPLFLPALFALLILSSETVSAEEYQTCRCGMPEPGWAPTCEQCTSDCSGEIEAFLSVTGRSSENTSSCGGPDPELGGVICNCSFETVIPAAGTCSDDRSTPTFRCTGVAIITIEEDYPCANDSECSGEMGTCVADRCFCNPTTSKCKRKLEQGTVCAANTQCISGYCYFQGDDRTQKVCLNASLRPEETKTDTTPESEVFPTYNVKSPIGDATGPQLIGRIIKTVLTLVGALALLMFVYGGFTWLTSGGSSDKIKKGKDILMWATIGLVVVFASYTLVDFLLRAFGL